MTRRFDLTPETVTLLQNEGYLMQGCFKSSLSGLLQAPSAEPGPFYSAFFNYAIGLERLLKLLGMLDVWHSERKFPDNTELKKYGGNSGHNLEMLHQSVRALFPKYGVEWKSTWNLDDINQELLKFLAGFANGSRYFNLDQLAGSSRPPSENPDLPLAASLFIVHTLRTTQNRESITSRPDVDEDAMSSIRTHVPPRHSSSRPPTYLLAAGPHLLVPLQGVAYRPQPPDSPHDDLARGGEGCQYLSAVHMEEFLEFVC